jgi:hypothetical protein
VVATQILAYNHGNNPLSSESATFEIRENCEPRGISEDIQDRMYAALQEHASRCDCGAADCESPGGKKHWIRLLLERSLQTGHSKTTEVDLLISSEPPVGGSVQESERALHYRGRHSGLGIWQEVNLVALP